MDWKQLLSAKRWGYEDRTANGHFDARSEFQRDYDRLIFSSPFRRLQNKTQVFPLPGSVFVHNRLTHSLEVAGVGRSLGRLFYSMMKSQNPDIDAEQPLLQEVDNVVSAACLSHDLGNPAFGHSGEAAISSFFANGPGREYEDIVSPAQWADLTHFEGNANALRILTHPFNGKSEKGFALTYSTLAAIVKYPCAARDGHSPKNHHRKKYGYFDSEKTVFKRIANELGLKKDPQNPNGHLRHPLVYLVEAADDICYNIIDLEDAHGLNILSYTEVEELLFPLCGEESLRARLNALADRGSRVELLRAKAINTLVQGCARVFAENQDRFLAGTFDKPLMEALAPETVSHLKKITEISVDRIYNAPMVVQIEIAGFKVMNALLEEFLPAHLKEKKGHFDRKIVAMIPEQFRPPGNTEAYAKIRSVLDFVSGMTDVYAVDLYRKMQGVSMKLDVSR